MKAYVFNFRNDFVNFHFDELLSICELSGIQCTLNRNDDKPFCVIKLSCDKEVLTILQRSILIKSASQLWAEGPSYENVFELLRKDLSNFQNYFEEDQSWCIRIISYGKRLHDRYILKRINEFGFLPLKGPVDLVNPENTFFCYEYYGDGVHPSKIPENPHYVYFGRLIGKGQTSLSDKYSLQQRCYIGNTSMDPTLSIIMANLSLAKNGRVVFDPFVGTGSLLLTAAHFGAHVLGADIAYDVIHAEGRSSRAHQIYHQPGENIVGNFKQYGLGDKFIGVLIADFSRTKLWACRDDFGGLFDAIVTDPPYGLREKTTKLGKKRADSVVKSNCRHYPSKTHYHITNVFLDLLDFAAKYLLVNGRLVYWFPVFGKDGQYNSDVIPRHAALQLIANCEQRLQLKRSRRLIVMKKCRQPQEGECAYLLTDMYATQSFRDKIHTVNRSEQALQN